MDNTSRDPFLVLPQDIREKLNGIQSQLPFTDEQLDELIRRARERLGHGLQFPDILPRTEEVIPDSPDINLPFIPGEDHVELEELPFIPPDKTIKLDNIPFLGSSGPDTSDSTESSIRITFPPPEEVPELTFTAGPEPVEPPISHKTIEQANAELDFKPTLVEPPEDDLQESIKRMDFSDPPQPYVYPPEFEALDPKYNRYSEADPAAFDPNPPQKKGDAQKPEAPVEREQNILQSIRSGCEAMVKLAEIGEEIHKQMSQLLDKDGSLARLARQGVGGQADRAANNEPTHRLPKDEFEREFEDFRRRHGQKQKTQPKGDARRKP